MLFYLGVDPGKSGGAAVISHKDRTSPAIVFKVFSFKDKTDSEINEFFQDFLSSRRVNPILLSGAILEQVGASPQMGVTSAFTFGRGYGFLNGLLVAHGISYENVIPNTWETKLRCRSGGKKAVTRKKAQQLYANQFPFGTKGEDGYMKSITDQIADALLIATYCSRKERGLC